MISFYKQALYSLLMLLGASVALVLLALDHTFLSNPLMPRHSSTMEWFSETDTDQYDGGNSVAIIHDDSYLLDAELRLSEVLTRPYTAVSLVFSDPEQQRIHRDLRAYQYLSFNVKCSTDSVLALLVYTVDPTITQLNNYLTYRAPHRYFNCSKQWQRVSVNLTDMALPAWWLQMFELNLADDGYSLAQVAKIQLGTTAQSPINETIRVQINTLTLNGEDWDYLYFTAALLVLLWLLYAGWLFHGHGKALVQSLQHKILSERPLVAYQQLSLAPHRNTPSDTIIRYLAEHFAHPELNMDMAVSALGINRTKMNELLKAELGLTFTSYLNKLRLAEASRLLTESDNCNIADIAYTVGYKNISYFNKLFKEEYGCTPKYFKQHVYPPSRTNTLHK
ncbi:helix-turn-helix domain-containing protein [Alteromonas sp. AMM-1]|uniref:helix-turn-helix domain-containing protein n=1 Tax=Alteromonas sp. AMM-1 TaxID=3394233 RepID=UPI0039A41FA1